ncbi:beta strand repeat-containing protein [Tundrisphaera lichenicola]|uniref:beta strand repeat-containing protein n=1 Tax=Tundrisphaera lichenicola TaxID=2029860 RepID=UPI003EB84595
MTLLEGASSFSKWKNRPTRPARRAARVSGFETLESRQLMATFAVTNLKASGPGSLREAILRANALPGADTIDFSRPGTIKVGRNSLPSITDTLTIDGTSAPSFAGSPVVTVNLEGTKGFQFARGADRSILSSLSVINAGNAGVTLVASHVTVEGNFIGLQSDGRTVAANKGDGIQINASSHDNLIGRSDPVTGIAYQTPSVITSAPVSAWQGIRNAASGSGYLIAGTSGTNGLLYQGPISGGGVTSLVNVPGATATSIYGPDTLANGVLRLVGSYKTGNDTVQGFLFEGTDADFANAGNYTTIDYPGAMYTYVHSTMGGLAVGNADGPEGNAPLGTGHAFLYDVASKSLLPDIIYPGSTTTTAYGIWYNGGTSYTICGGYTSPSIANGAVANAYLVDYDSATGKYSQWTSFAYPNGLVGQDFITHFEGISSDEKGVYTLVADSVQVGSNNPVQGSFVSVRRNTDRSFGPGQWVDLNDPTVPGFVSANSVAGNQVVGVIFGPSTQSYQATVNVGFRLSNVISGNGGNGIGIYGSNDNTIAMNNIGTDGTGTRALGNKGNGILVTKGARGNMIGGQATGGNNPTAGVFVRPPQGNLISGNKANGVLINARSSDTLLSGNFVGTAASGNSALGNKLDGVAIVDANDNKLIGCTFQQDPFVFYNVLSGNGGNGLRIHNSNNTTVQANFMGAGANNASVVANGGDGLLVSGNSRNTQVGGVIPLGNVISGNDGNGIEVKDRASGFISFNTFAGVFAFGGSAPNKKDGMLITSSGGNNLLRTNIVSGNLGNGIELGGNATGVEVTQTAVGTNTSIMYAIPNHGDGIRISGRAHGNAIGGFQRSVEPQVTVSANLGYGIAIVDKAHDNVIYNTNIGTNFDGSVALGNTRGGILLGPGTSGTTIGGGSSTDRVVINYNAGAGITMKSSGRNKVLGSQIQANAGGGIVIDGGKNNQVGSNVAGNTISHNGGNGLTVGGLVHGSTVQGNQINSNTGDGILLKKARRLIIGGPIPGSGNQILSNFRFGLEATGNCAGTAARGNTIANNVLGNVNLANSRGVVILP